MRKVLLSTNLNLKIYEPETPNGTCFFIMHGMVEHLGRYVDLIDFLLKNGITVSGFHYPGHGTNQPLGIMDKSMIDVIEQSVIEAQRLLKEQYNMNVIIHFAHSLGTFFTRNMVNSLDVNHIILSGAGVVDAKKIKSTQSIIKYLSLIISKKRTSMFFCNLVFSDFMKPFERKNGLEFISSIEEEQKKYIVDPLCGGAISIGFIEMLLELSFRVSKKEENGESISTPITLMSGKEDSVGNMGEAIVRLGDYFKKTNTKNTEVQFFEGRHEILNDISKDQMMESILRICRAY